LNLQAFFSLEKDHKNTPAGASPAGMPFALPADPLFTLYYSYFIILVQNIP
jgi:hypothetical protein